MPARRFLLPVSCESIPLYLLPSSASAPQHLHHLLAHGLPMKVLALAFVVPEEEGNVLAALFPCVRKLQHDLAEFLSGRGCRPPRLSLRTAQVSESKRVPKKPFRLGGILYRGDIADRARQTKICVKHPQPSLHMSALAGRIRTAIGEYDRKALCGVRKPELRPFSLLARLLL